jgi:hypothetical protein
MGIGYNGRQVVGMDLHRRRSVLVRVWPGSAQYGQVLATAPDRTVILSSLCYRTGPPIVHVTQCAAARAGPSCSPAGGSRYSMPDRPPPGPTSPLAAAMITTLAAAVIGTIGPILIPPQLAELADGCGRAR